MKIIQKLLVVCLFIFFNNLSVFASDYQYDVEGYSDDGTYIYGEIEANRNERDVEGYIYDEKGNELYFEGEWVGHGEIEGYDEEGNYIELETQ